MLYHTTETPLLGENNKADFPKASGINFYHLFDSNITVKWASSVSHVSWFPEVTLSSLWGVELQAWKADDCAPSRLPSAWCGISGTAPHSADQNIPIAKTRGTRFLSGVCPSRDGR